MISSPIARLALLFISFLLFCINVSGQKSIPVGELIGRYEFDNGMAIQFRTKGSTLFLITPGNPLQEMELLRTNTYRSKTLKNDEFVFSKPGDSIKVNVNNSFGTITGTHRSGEVVDNTETMDSLITLRSKSKHFEYWYNEADKQVIDSLSDYLEKSYDRILSDFKISALPITRVKIYPDLKLFHTAINQPDAPAEVLATAFGKDEFRMVSPSKGGEDMLKFISHEFTHCVHLNIDYSPNNPRWLWEGLAMYESGWFMDPNGLEDIKSKKFPALSSLSNGMEYMLGYVVIEAIKDQYGFDKVIELIKTQGDIKKVFGLSDEEFNDKVFGFIHKKYVR